MRSNTKQALLVTLVGVTLFVALLRLSDVLAFAAQLVDLVLPILAGGILALFLSVPMAGLEKRLGRLFAKARKQPSGKALHLLSFLLTLLGVVLVLVLALTLLIPELVQSFHSLYLQIEANIPRWTAYLHAQDPDMGWLMSRLEGIDWEQLLHRVTDSIDTAHDSGDDLTVSVKNIMNEAYCRDISIKTRSSLDVKRRNGDFVGAFPVYGYMKAEDNKNLLVPDPYAARVVCDIFRMRLEGASASKIASELNRLGILSPLAYKKNNGLPYAKNGVRGQG